MQNPQFKSPRPARHKIAILAAVVACAAMAHASIPTTYPTGSGVTIGFSNGQVTYGFNSVGDRIPDYSKSGYMGGEVPIPTPPVTTTLNPNATGDDTARIQSAIDNIGNMPIGGNGFRGVLKLNAGVYRINTALIVNKSGIVIRGAGSGPNGTILRRTANNGDAIIVQNDGSLQSEVSGTRHNITTSYVPVGATYFTLDSVAGLAVGDTIMIQRGPTQAWVTNLPEPDTTRGPGNYGVKWDRVITEIDGTRIRIDAPIMQAIEANWCDGYVFKYTWPSRISNCGIEDLRCDSPGNNVDSRGETDGNTCKFDHVINCWVRRVWNDHMRGHCVQIDGSKWVTAQDVTSFHNPLGSHSGASIQIFTGSFADSILYHHITAHSAGFEFTAGRQHGGPIVFTESEVPDGFAASGPHMQGNAGMVWDNCRMDHSISVEYQGKGWGGFNPLIYNTDAPAFNGERPNTVHWWVMGGHGSVNQGSMSAQSLEQTSVGSFKTPQALFRAQLTDRVGATLANTILGSTAIGSTDPGTGGGSADFTISATPSSRAVTAGNGTTYTVSIAAVNGFSGTVGFSSSGLPAGVSASFSPSSVSGSGSSTCTVTTSASTTPGNYTLTFTGTSGSLVHSTTVTLTVNSSGGTVTTYEAESLVIAGKSSDNVTTNSEAGASNGQYVQLFSDAANDFITLRLPNVPAGTYAVRIGVKKNTNRGIAQTQGGPAGGTLANIDGPIDLYGASAFTFFDIGNWTVSTTGNQDVKFLVTGKNASSSSFNLAIDYIQLTQVSAPVTYEAENLTISATSGDTFSTNSEASASGGKYIMFNSNAAGDFIRFKLLNIAPNTYNVKIGYKQYTSRGIAQVKVGMFGGTLGDLGDPVDMYGTTAFLEEDIGTWTIGTLGDKSVEFNITGKNASSSGFTAAIDYIKLTPQ